jgi:N utilization substance protein A
MNGELLRLVDVLHREKNIDKETLIAGIEAALLSALKKHYAIEEGAVVSIDRLTGAIHARVKEAEVDPTALGRIAAQTAKQVIIQKNREAERDALFEEYKDRVSTIVNGMIQHHEAGCSVVNLGKLEGILPKSEQIPGEEHAVGERVRSLVLEVRKVGQKVKVVLSRTHPDFIRRLFEVEVPEIAEKTIEIKALAREAGHRSKVAVASYDSRVDAVGACVGVRGRRIKNIVDELSGEKIDIVRWNDSPQVLIMNALKPAEIETILLSPETKRATVVVPEDQLSLAIGKKGQNVRLAARLSDWNIDIVTAAELNEQREQARREFLRLAGVGPTLADRLIQAGFISIRDLLEAGPEVLMGIEGVGERKVQEIVTSATELLPTLEAEAAQRAADLAARSQGESERLGREAAQRQALKDREDAEVAAARRRLEALGQVEAPTPEAAPAAESQGEAPEDQAAPADQSPDVEPPALDPASDAERRDENTPASGDEATETDAEAPTADERPATEQE